MVFFNLQGEKNSLGIKGLPVRLPTYAIFQNKTRVNQITCCTTIELKKLEI